eukprot:scaffold4407_cov123-Isochrysis_galbana.AAC.3
MRPRKSPSPHDSSKPYFSLSRGSCRSQTAAFSTRRSTPLATPASGSPHSSTGWPDAFTHCAASNSRSSAACSLAANRAPSATRFSSVRTFLSRRAAWRAASACQRRASLASACAALPAARDDACVTPSPAAGGSGGSVMNESRNASSEPK